jgi:hypothetical protein
MSLEAGEILYLLLIGLAFLELILVFPTLLTMHFLMPKAILEKYFKPPYFRPMEVEMFTGIPYAPMRTVMLLWVMAYPKLGKKRGLTTTYMDAPQWYRLSGGILITSILVVLILILLLVLGFFIYMNIPGNNL